MSEVTTVATVVVPVVANTPHALPEYGTPDSAGLDLRAKLDAPVVLHPRPTRPDPHRTALRTPARVRSAGAAPERPGLQARGDRAQQLQEPLTQTTEAKLAFMLINHGQRSPSPSKTANALPSWSLAQIRTHRLGRHRDRRTVARQSTRGTLEDLASTGTRIKPLTHEHHHVPMAGRGSRLRPHTLTVPKPLVPVGGKPIVERLVGRHCPP